MSYAQAVKHSHNHRHDRFRQPIILGSFTLPKHVHSYVPVHRTAGDKEPYYEMCLYCDSRRGIEGITLQEFIDRDIHVIAAKNKIQRIHDRMSSRWGEARRFAGRSAGIRIEQLDRAYAQHGKAIDKAIEFYNKLYLK